MVDLSKFTNEESRRSVLKKGALATAGAGLLGASAGSAAAQDDGDGGLEEYEKGLLSVGQARPGSRFVISSPVLEWTPRAEEITDNVWSDYNTRVARYLNTDEQVLFWVAETAEIPPYSEEQGYVVDSEAETTGDGTPRPEVYEFHTEWSPFGDAAYVTVNFTPVGEGEADDLLANEDWWVDDGQDDAPAEENETTDGER